MQGTFWSLVKHDMKLRKRRAGQFSRWWRIFYATVVVVVAVVVTTYIIRTRGSLDLRNIWLFTFGLPFMAFGMATALTVHEWKNGTFGWWLALPMSRMRLLTSKFVAALLRTVLGLAGIYGLIALLSLYAMLLQGSFTWQAAGSFLFTGVKWIVLLFSVCPLVAAGGILFGVLTESSLKPALPLMWVGFGGIWWLIFSRDNHYLRIISENGGAASLAMSPTLFYPIAISWVLAFLVLFLASYVLDRQLTL